MMTPLKSRLFKKILVPIMQGCEQTSALKAARAMAGDDVKLVGLIYIPEGESLSTATGHAREVRETLKSLSNVKHIHRWAEVYASHRPWDELVKIIEKESPDLLVLEYPCQFEMLGSEVGDVFNVREPLPIPMIENAF